MERNEWAGAKIRQARQRRRMTQEDLAKAVGVDRAAVSRWETGQHYPERFTALVEDVLGIELTQPEAAAS